MSLSRYLFFALILVSFSGCKGTRFYWESKLVVKKFSSSDWHALKTQFGLDAELSGWHPVFGKYCSGFKNTDAHLFACWKKNEIRVISSYPGILKGDSAINDSAITLEKYLGKVSEMPGYDTHIDIKTWIVRKYHVSSHTDRLLTYGKGSFIIKDELSEGN